MNVISLRDYAKQNHVSYEAVRKQVSRYKKELGEHIVMDGRQQFLDEEAVEFLNDKRQKNPVIIVQQDKDETIEALRLENKNLLTKVAAQADKLSELAQWKADNVLAITDAEHRQHLLEEANKEKKLLESFIADAKEEIKALNDEKADLSADNKQKDELLQKAEKTAQEATESLTAFKSMSRREFAKFKRQQRKEERLLKKQAKSDKLDKEQGNE